MTPATILTQTKTEGLILSLSETGGIGFEGNRQVAEKWRPIIREHKAEIIEAMKAAANDPKPAHWKWHLHFVDRNPLTVSCSPEATHDEVMAMYPDAVAAEPVSGNAPSEPFDREAWEERAGICEFDGGLSREEAEGVAWEEDNRRRCSSCLNLLASGVCSRASPSGPIVARRGYKPDPARLQRCPEYRPGQNDPDRRTGRERWQGLEGKP